MNLDERVAIVDCEGERLIGIVTRDDVPDRVGMLVIVGGPQYRVGSHRQFVLLARRLASEGVPVLRFDCRGMGDAAGPERSFEEMGPDIAAAIDTFRAACPDVERVVLWGLCDAASAALCYWHARRDPRVAGMVLLNPWVRSLATNARTQIKHYYGRRLLEGAFWRKLFRGDVDVGAAARGVQRGFAAVIARRDTASAKLALTFRDLMAEGLRTFPGPVLLILSGRDLTAKEFLEYVRTHAEWAGMLERPGVTRHDIADADHTFSSAQWRGEVEAVTQDWLRRCVMPRSQ